MCPDRLLAPSHRRRRQPPLPPEVVELTDLVNLEAWPKGTRLIVRRERPLPCAQLTLFDTIESYRHTAFITNTAAYNVAALEYRLLQRARADSVIRDAKATGLANLPFDCIVNNGVWVQLCFAARDLMSWAQRIGCTGQVRRPTPTTIRHRLLHVAARTTPHRLPAPPRPPLAPDPHPPRLIKRVRTAFVSLTVTTRPPLSRPYAKIRASDRYGLRAAQPVATIPPACPSPTTPSEPWT